MKTTTRKVRLGDVAHIASSLVDPREQPYRAMLHVGGANIESRTGKLIDLKTAAEEDLQSGKYVFDQSMILYSKIRPYLVKVAFPGFSGLCSADIYPLSVDSAHLDAEYLFYLLQSHEFTDYAIRGSNRAGMPKVNREHLFAYQAGLPDLNEQQRVVARVKECLRRVEEIEGLRKENAVDAVVLRSAVFADYVADLSSIDYVEAVLGDVVTDCKYGTSQKASANGNGCPVLRMGNIRDGRIETSNLKHVELSDRERKKYLLRPGDILVNRTNSLELVGKSAVFDGRPGDWVYASYLVRVRVDPTKALPQYVNAVINSRIGRAYVFSTARRAIGMVNINAKEIQRMPLPLPSIEVQTALTAKMDDAEALVEEVIHNLEGDEVKHLREAVLRKAFAGEL